MFKNENELTLSDLIDVKILQEFQDVFSNTMGVASITVDSNGPITKPSNFTDFCHKYTRGSSEGFRRCNECDIKWGKTAVEKGRPTIYTCHAGLTDFAVPIIIQGKHFGSILGGQVLNEPPKEFHFRAIARRFGVDEDGYIEALNKIKVVPMETIEKTAHLLSLLANAVSEIGFKNLKLIEKNRREKIYRTVVEAIRGTLDITETKKTIVEIVGKTLKADRCFIVEYDKKNDKFLNINEQYLSSTGVEKYTGIDVNMDFPNFLSMLKKGQPVIFNKKKVLENNNSNFDVERRTIEKYDISSIFASPLFYKDELLGVLSIHYEDASREVTEDEINLMSMISNQIAIAIYQAKLFEVTNLRAQREKLLGDVITKSICTFDINQIKQIVREIGIMTKADRCYFLELEKSGKGKPIDYEGEYLASADIKSIMGHDFPAKEGEMFTRMYMEAKDLVVFDYEEIENKQNPEYAEMVNYSKCFNLKCTVGIPIFSDEKVIAILAIEFVKEKVLPSEDDLEFLRLVGKQTAMAYRQIRLYHDTIKAAERDKINNNIIDILRSTLDVNSVKNLFVNNIGQYFHADRVIFSEFDSKNDMYLPPDGFSEYLSSPKEKSFVGFDWSDALINEYIQPLIAKEELNIFCWEEYIKDNPKSQEFVRLFEDADVKSSYNIPVLYQDNILGYFCIEFTQKVCRLTDEDLDSIRRMCHQAGIALYHSYLYEHANKSAKSKADFIANMSHEIKTPLNIVIGFSELLSESQLDRQKQIDYLKNINKSGKHLLALTNDIINISKIDSGNLELNYEKVDTCKLIKEVVDSIKLIAEGKDIDISIDMVKSTISADKKMLTQILYNLLNNAIKFTLQGGKVILKSELNNNKLYISIEDTGIGIADCDKDKIFEEFRQLDSAYEKKQEGAGLGLAISKRLIELHNGSIHVESTQGKGSKFWFVLPTNTNVEAKVLK